MTLEAFGVLAILIMAIANMDTVTSKSSKTLQDYYRENPFEKNKKSEDSL